MADFYSAVDIRLIRLGRAQHPDEAEMWLFPAASSNGHIAETKEDRADLSKWGNDLRQTFRTAATVAKVSSVDAKLLMNHAIPGVNEGYITREKILEDHLRAQQEAISSVIFSTIKDARGKPGPLNKWLKPRGAREIIEAAKLVEPDREASMPKATRKSRPIPVPSSPPPASAA